MWQNVVNNNFLHQFMLFHLMECIPFDFPYTIYLNILFITKTLGGNDDIYYVALLNKILWGQGAYLAFNAVDDSSKEKIIIKVSMLAKQ